MRKIFSIPIVGCLAMVAAVGCAREKKADDNHSSVLEHLPFVYKMTVQQGNIITQEMVSSLELGMTKRQVNFVLGTPLLTDFFHSNRWDYIYTVKRGRQPMEQRNLTLFFQDDKLTRIGGDIHADRKPADASEPKEILVKVPDYSEREGMVTKSLKAVGLEPKE